MTAINTNTISLNAQRNLQNNSASLATTIQRLSSGLRINSARDDAAGLAISERFTTQIRGLNVAVRNANDGISLAQTAEGALGEISSNLQRIRELAVQSANATNSATDRAALDAEAQALKSEIDRVAAQAEFNGIKLLDGSFQGQLFQVGTQGGQAIAIGAVGSARLEQLGKSRLADEDSFRVVAPAGTTVGTTQPFGVDVSTLGFDENAPTDQAARDSFLQAVATALDAPFTSSATYNATTGDLVVTNVAWASLIVDLTNIGGTSQDLPFFGTLTMNRSALTLSVVNAADEESRGIADVNLLTASSSRTAIRAMDAALDQINAERADLGAVQNRFSSVVANLTTSAENLSASRSRIRDTDYAKETAELTRTQILQQAGTALLAQANQIPQNVLSLLR